jgi:hypothetical protein
MESTRTGMDNVGTHDHDAILFHVVSDKPYRLSDSARFQIDLHDDVGHVFGKHVDVSVVSVAKHPGFLNHAE